MPLTLSAIPSYTVYITGGAGSTYVPPAKLYSPNFVWQIWDNGQEIYNTSQFGVNAAVTYIGCDPTPTSPDSCKRAGSFYGSRALFLNAGTHNLALRMCDTASGKCYITAPLKYAVANSAAPTVFPKKPVLQVASPLLRPSPASITGNFSDTTPFTAQKSQLADSAQISAERSTGIANVYWVFSAYNVTQPVTKNVVVNQVAGYDQSMTGTFSLNYISLFMGPGTSFNFILSVCNNLGAQCTSSDPVAASMP